jgi:hypothetical protein
LIHSTRGHRERCPIAFAHWHIACLPNQVHKEDNDMRFITTALALVAAGLLSVAPALAQTTSGTIIGRVVDNQNLAVPGVTVSVEGPNLQGANTAVTSANGDYILPQLPPGTYTVSFTLSGFGRQQKTIAVAPTQTVPLNVTLGLAALDETVNVVGKSADVLTQTAQVATNFQQDLIAMLPTNRDITSALLMAPAVHPSGPAATSRSPARCHTSRSTW